MDDAEKGMRAPFGSIAGKKYMAPKILPGIPPHRLYCEPFAGGAALFWSKKKEDSQVEVLSDIDPDIVNGYSFLRDMNDEDVAWLMSQKWDVSRQNFQAAKALKPVIPREQFWKFKVEQSSSWSGNRKNFGYKKQGPWAGLKRLSVFKERLAGVKTHAQSWDKTIAMYDSPDSFFFIDPPYNDRIKAHGDALFPKSYIIPTVQLRRVLRTMKGKFVLTVSDIPENRTVFNCFKQLRVPTEQHQGPLQVGSTTRKRTELILSNFDFQPSGGRTIAQKGDVENEFVIKNAVERIVGGIVYKARKPDSQGDWAEADQIREAMYAFMETGPQFSTDHATPTDCKVLECFQAEKDTMKEGGRVSAGSWWLTLRIIDDETWERIEKGELTGYSWEGLILREEGVSPS